MEVKNSTRRPWAMRRAAARSENFCNSQDFISCRSDGMLLLWISSWYESSSSSPYEGCALSRDRGPSGQPGRECRPLHTPCSTSFDPRPTASARDGKAAPLPLLIGEAPYEGTLPVVVDPGHSGVLLGRPRRVLDVRHGPRF